MKSSFILGRLILTDIKRLKNYITSILISSVIIMTICGVGGFILSKNVYKESSLDTIAIAYYLPEDKNLKTNTIAIGMLEDIKSMQSIATLIQVNTLEEGYKLIEKGDVLYYIIVPENFFSGIMNGTNTPLEIVVWDNSSITAYIANELFISYAKYLGFAQSAVYSLLDTLREHEVPKETISALQTSVNMTFLDRALNKDNFIDTKTATNQGDISLIWHYLASALMLSLFFISFVLIPHLQGAKKGVILKLSIYNLNNAHIFISNFISSIIALYIAFIPCYIGISIITGQFNPIGLITMLLPIGIISFIISAVCFFTKNTFAANMTILVIALLLAYSGGGILPSAMLPDAVKNFFGSSLGHELISTITSALYG